MKAFYQSWLAQRANIPGLLLCSVSLPDKTYLSCSSAVSFPVEQAEKVLQQVGEFACSLVQNRLTATRLRWSFAKAHLHWAARSDNTSMVLVTPEDGTCDRSVIDSLMQEFLELKPSVAQPSL